jgi:hypothetical protein
VPSLWNTPRELCACDRAVRVLKRLGAPRGWIRRGGLLNAQLMVRLRRARLRRWARHALQGPRTVRIVLGVRNRGGPRLDNCLKTLQQQDYPSDLLTVALVDFGSTPEMRPALDQSAARYGAELITVEADAWNRSRCINRGIRSSDALITMYGDVDLLYSPSYVSSVVAHLAATPLRVCYSHVWDLPDTVSAGIRPDGTLGMDELRRLKKAASRRFSDTHLGLGIGATFTRFLQEIGGFDEAFVGWGCEDEDMNGRLLGYGLHRLDISNEDTFYLHQFHSRRDVADDGADRAPWERNKLIRAESVTIRRNGRDWGTAADIPTN